MISRRQLPELRAFMRAEAQLPLRSAPEYANLVVPNGNSSRAVHKWFKYKEAFSADLVGHILRTQDVEASTGRAVRLLDPFCGVGTGLLSAQLLAETTYRVEAIGIECNPFSAFVAKTKLSWPRIDPRRLRRLAAAILARESSSPDSPIPVLSSIRSGRCITPYMARQLVAARRKIEALNPGPERDALLLGLSASIEVVSKVRRDGRALRIVSKPRTTLNRVLARWWETIASDVESLQRDCQKPSDAEVLLGDGRRPATVGVQDGTVDLIVTSPPYPNNIDYNEVYKLELWFMGFAETSEEFLSLRRETFRSHPTCSAPQSETEYEKTFKGLLAEGPLADLLGVVSRRASRLDRECSRGRSKVLLGYAYDTWCSLRAHLATLKRGGRAIYVVGNSLHGGPESPYLVPTDLMLARLGELVGFRVEQIVVARPLLRRLAGNHFLRDSIVFLRKM